MPASRKRITSALRRERNDRPPPPHSQHSQKYPRPAVLEPEEGLEPSTFRLRVGPKPSNWTRPVPSWLLRSGADSIETRPVGPGTNAWVAREVATLLREPAAWPPPPALVHPIAIGCSQLVGSGGRTGIVRRIAQLRQRSVCCGPSSMSTPACRQSKPSGHSVKASRSGPPDRGTDRNSCACTTAGSSTYRADRACGQGSRPRSASSASRASSQAA